MSEAESKGILEGFPFPCRCWLENQLARLPTYKQNFPVVLHASRWGGGELFSRKHCHGHGIQPFPLFEQRDVPSSPQRMFITVHHCRIMSKLGLGNEPGDRVNNWHTWHPDRLASTKATVSGNCTDPPSAFAERATAFKQYPAAATTSPAIFMKCDNTVVFKFQCKFSIYKYLSTNRRDVFWKYSIRLIWNAFRRYFGLCDQLSSTKVRWLVHPFAWTAHQCSHTADVKCSLMSMPKQLNTNENVVRQTTTPRILHWFIFMGWRHKQRAFWSLYFWKAHPLNSILFLRSFNRIFSCGSDDNLTRVKVNFPSQLNGSCKVTLCNFSSFHAWKDAHVVHWQTFLFEEIPCKEQRYELIFCSIKNKKQLRSQNPSCRLSQSAEDPSTIHSKTVWSRINTQNSNYKFVRVVGLYSEAENQELSFCTWEVWHDGFRLTHACRWRICEQTSYHRENTENQQTHASVYPACQGILIRDTAEIWSSLFTLKRVESLSRPTHVVGNWHAKHEVAALVWRTMLKCPKCSLLRTKTAPSELKCDLYNHHTSTSECEYDLLLSLPK